MATSMQFCMETNSDWLKAIIPEEGATDDSSSPSEELMPCPLRPQAPMLERRLRPPHDEALKCPRCDSTHTKFCYYNNYSLSQPRYFCKTCRRYWTKGGSLRNVPVGGGCRKNKRPSSKKTPVTDQVPPMIHQYPMHHQLQATDLHLSNLNFMFDSANDHFSSSFGMGLGEQGNTLGFSIDGTCQRLLLPFGGQEEEIAVDVKPGNRMLSLEWPDQGCNDSFGYSNGLGLWAGMLNGHGPSSAAM